MNALETTITYSFVAVVVIGLLLLISLGVQYLALHLWGLHLTIFTCLLIWVFIASICNMLARRSN